jgi:hypothetical protein
VEAGVTAERDAAIARLDDYLRAQQPDAEVEAYEEELFARALRGEAKELQFRQELGHRLREMQSRGSLDLWLTARDVERMQQSGLRIARFEVDPENPWAPDLSGDFDLLITKVPVDLRGVHRLDAEVFSADGKQLKLMPQISFDPADGAVFACCEIELARAAAAAKTVTKVWGYDEAGTRTLLGELHSA